MLSDRVRYDGEQSSDVSELSTRLARETRLYSRQRSSTRRGLLAPIYWSSVVFSRPYWVVRSCLWYDVLSVCRLLSVVCL